MEKLNILNRISGRKREIKKWKMEACGGKMEQQRRREINKERKKKNKKEAEDIKTVRLPCVWFVLRGNATCCED